MADASAPTSRLVELAPELLELVLSHLSPHDLVRFGQTCSHAYAFVQPSNQVLWRSAFLNVFDDPGRAWNRLGPTARSANLQRESTWDYYEEVRQRHIAFNVICRDATPTGNPEDVVTTLLHVLDTASFPSYERPPHTSLNLDFLERLWSVAASPERIIHDYHRDNDSFSLPLDLMTDQDQPITRSSLLARTAAVPEWASKLHIFYGMTKREDESLQAKSCARGVVYDWALTGQSAEYGPLVKDGSGTVNWQALEAITSLMNRIFEMLRKAHSFASPSGFRNSISGVLPLHPAYPEDWAGVNRSWVGTYAFLDYRALVHYNFANHLEYHMDLGAYEEACGDLMRLDLKVSDSEELRSDERLHSNLPMCDDLPKLFFSGSSRGRPGGRPSIMVRGYTCLCPNGLQVRWRFIIRFVLFALDSCMNILTYLAMRGKINGSSMVCNQVASDPGVYMAYGVT
jgi:hypothetical protein